MASKVGKQDGGIERTLANAERKDRSVRLWGERGQLALEAARICLLNATPTGTEILKNLVLPGVAQFTIVDSATVSVADLGNNFFVDMESIGKPRCSVVTGMLVEMNDEVSGHWVEEDPSRLIEKDLTFFDEFTCIIACDVAETVLLKLADHLWSRGIPMFVAKAYGLIGYWRSVVPEVAIIESRPEFPMEDLRVVNPFPELAHFFQQFDVESASLSKRARTHIPAFVLLHHALTKFSPNRVAPKTAEEKRQFKAIVESLAIQPDQENILEALTMAPRSVFAYSQPQIPSNVAALFSDPDCEQITSSTSSFWILVRALREFVANEGAGFLPLSGTIPDMHCDTQTYVTLQKLYQDKSSSDTEAVAAHVSALQAAANNSRQISADRIKLFCKNANNLQIVKMRSLAQEIATPLTSEWSFNLDMPDLSSHHYYILIRAVERFRSQFQRFPDGDDLDVVKLKELCSQFCTDIGLPASTVKDEAVCEMCWHGGVETHAVAAVIGGVGAQEIQKIIMQQFVPLNNTFIFNGVSCINTIANF